MVAGLSLREGRRRGRRARRTIGTAPSGALTALADDKRRSLTRPVRILRSIRLRRLVRRRRGACPADRCRRTGLATACRVRERGRPRADGALPRLTHGSRRLNGSRRLTGSQLRPAGKSLRRIRGSPRLGGDRLPAIRARPGVNPGLVPRIRARACLIGGRMRLIRGRPGRPRTGRGMVTSMAGSCHRAGSRTALSANLATRPSIVRTVRFPIARNVRFPIVRSPIAAGCRCASLAAASRGARGPISGLTSGRRSRRCRTQCTRRCLTSLALACKDATRRRLTAGRTQALVFLNRATATCRFRSIQRLWQALVPVPPCERTGERPVQTITERPEPRMSGRRTVTG